VLGDAGDHAGSGSQRGFDQDLAVHCQAADRMLDRIWDGFRVIARFPHGGTARPELAANLRCYTVGNYVIYFRPAQDGVEIARVLHAARDADAILGGD
jgi:toxin ParE1/3/4